ncbi:MAG: hypothetical protein ACOY4R_06725 [Pseudomonadota bacterium]
MRGLGEIVVSRQGVMHAFDACLVWLELRGDRPDEWEASCLTRALRALAMRSDLLAMTEIRAAALGPTDRGDSMTGAGESYSLPMLRAGFEQLRRLP